VDAYAKVAEAVVDEDRRRALAVKSLPTSDLEREAIVSLLIGDVLLGPSFEVAAAKLGEWHAARPDDGLPPYLLGKNFYARGRWQEAAAYLDRALELRLDLPLVAREAWRSRLIVACALEDHAAARRAMAALLSRSDLSPAQREGVARLSARCGMTEELEESARTR
jgi:tetratricopeptide (TPR) repeat protein